MKAETFQRDVQVEFKPNLSFEVDLGTYEKDDSLLNGERLLVQFKGFNRLERLNRQSKQILNGEAGSSVERTVSDGSIVLFSELTSGCSLEDLSKVAEVSLSDTRGLVRFGDNIIVGSTDKVVDINTKNWQATKHPIQSEWLGFIHSLSISKNNSRLLIASSGYDRIIEADINSGKTIREWIAWENGFPLNERDGAVKISKNSLGLPPNLRTAFPNSVCYLDENNIVSTLFHHGLVKINLDSGSTEIIDSDLLRPHALSILGEEFFLADTANGRIVVYSKLDFSRKKTFSFKNVSELNQESEGREWLQYAKPLENGLYLAVDSNRTSIFIFDEKKRKIRRIPFNQNYVIQEAHIF